MKRVIIAEDVCEVLEKEQSFLSRSDIDLARADSNRSALEMHKAEKADLIVANLDDGEMSGEELCSIIRKDGQLRNVSIIMVCSGSDADVKRCMNCGANAFVSTPLNSAVILPEAFRLLNIAERKAHRFPVKVKCDGMKEGRPFVANVVNISSSGMLIRAQAGLMEGDSLVCAFTLPGLGKVTLTAEVVRVIPARPGREAGYGISFTDISSEAVSAIDSLAGSSVRDKVLG